MRKNIGIADDVYERLKREKGDRSFSEVIADLLETGTTLSDVTGQEIFTADTAESVTEDIETLSDRTLDRFEG